MNKATKTRKLSIKEMTGYNSLDEARYVLFAQVVYSLT